MKPPLTFTFESKEEFDIGSKSLRTLHYFMHPSVICLILHDFAILRGTGLLNLDRNSDQVCCYYPAKNIRWDPANPTWDPG